jgi:hypothetical protein
VIISPFCVKSPYLCIKIYFYPQSKEEWKNYYQLSQISFRRIMSYIMTMSYSISKIWYKCTLFWKLYISVKNLKRVPRATFSCFGGPHVPRGPDFDITWSKWSFINFCLIFLSSSKKMFCPKSREECKISYQLSQIISQNYEIAPPPAIASKLILSHKVFF